MKILDIRKNEHFGDVFMLLHKKSPFWLRVKSMKADLLLLKKLDAINLSANYQDIWETIIKKPLANSKMINRLTLKVLTNYCNFYGIKTKLFKRNKNELFPNYYLRPNISKFRIRKSKFIKKENNSEKNNSEKKSESIQEKDTHHEEEKEKEIDINKEKKEINININKISGIEDIITEESIKENENSNSIKKINKDIENTISFKYKNDSSHINNFDSEQKNSRKTKSKRR